MLGLRDRFQLVPGMHRARPGRVGGVFLALFAVVAFVGFTKDIPFTGDGRTEVRARFAAAPSVFPSTPVRVRGVEVGEITSVDREGREAVVTMRVDTDKGVEVRDDARADLYWRTLLGRNVYLELDPGSPSAPVLRGEIPTSRTSSQVEFDQLFAALDDDGRDGMQTSFDELRTGLSGPAAGQTITRLSPSLSAVAPAARALRGTQPGRDLPKLERGAAKALRALARDQQALAALLDDGAAAIGVTAARQTALARTVQDGPATLREADRTMRRLARTLDVLDPVAERLRPGLRGLAPTLRRTTPTMRRVTQVAPVATAALRDLAPALRALRAVGRDGIPLFDALAPTLARTADEIVPFLDARSTTTKLQNHEAIGPFFAAVGNSAATFDAFGFMQRFQPGQRAGSTGTDALLNPARCAQRYGLTGARAASACADVLGALHRALGGGATAAKAKGRR